MDASSSHGFSTQLIDDITHQCEIIFNLHDLVNNFPVFSVANALRILEVIQEIFMDIPNFEETLAFLNWHSNKQAINPSKSLFENPASSSGSVASSILLLPGLRYCSNSLDNSFPDPLPADRVCAPGFSRPYQSNMEPSTYDRNI